MNLYLFTANDSSATYGLEDAQPLIENDRETLRKERHISEQEFVILFVGRLHAAKGLLFLIEAFHFRKVLEQKPDCRLVIAGSGNLGLLTNTSHPKVIFTGLVELSLAFFLL